MKIASHAWLEIGPSENLFLPFKIMQNTKIADPLLTMSSFYDQDDILREKVLRRYYSKIMIWRHN